MSRPGKGCLSCCVGHCEHACCKCCAARSRVDPRTFKMVSQQLRVASASLSQNLAPPPAAKRVVGVFVCLAVCVFVPSIECHCSFTCWACSCRICPTRPHGWTDASETSSLRMATCAKMHGFCLQVFHMRVLQSFRIIPLSFQFRCPLPFKASHQAFGRAADLFSYCPVPTQQMPVFFDTLTGVVRFQDF